MTDDNVVKVGEDLTLAFVDNGDNDFVNVEAGKGTEGGAVNFDVDAEHLGEDELGFLVDEARVEHDTIGGIAADDKEHQREDRDPKAFPQVAMHGGPNAVPDDSRDSDRTT